MCKDHLVQRVDMVPEVLRVYQACLDARGDEEILDCRAIPVCKALLDHLDNRLCLNQRQMLVIHRLGTMTRDQQLAVLRVNQAPEVLRAHMEDQALRDQQGKMEHMVYRETEALRVQLELQVPLVLGDAMVTQDLQVLLGILDHVAQKEKRALKG